MDSASLGEASYAYQRRLASARRVLPRPLRRALRMCYFLALDGIDFCLQRRPDLVPPRWLNPIGNGDFEGTGDEFFSYFIEMCDLRPSCNVLDIGCGIGRMARPLTKYLSSGTYEGFDIVPVGIRWCQRNVTARYPNFHFTLADIRNEEYNANGLLSASTYQFPYADSCFDFAFLTSVFTHMRVADVAQYLSELSRVLVRGGKCLATFFLLNGESHELIGAGRSSLNFAHALSGCWTTDPQFPETAIGYRESDIMRIIGEKGFAIQSLSYGRWCGRAEYRSYQDIVVFTKV
jgi:SAM-dependent methyltransferase